MCPACMTTAALVVAGATSAGGLIALVMKEPPAKTGASTVEPTIQTGGKHDG